MVAATDRGLRSVALGDSLDDLERDLFEHFPTATRLDAGDDLCRAVVDRIEEPRSASTLALPLDVEGTDFQRLVWDALGLIPVGSTMTYAELARAIGRPSAVRAVGSACGSNELAVVIPCHRATRADGGLGGYRWGIDRKQALLDREAGPIDFFGTPWPVR